MLNKYENLKEMLINNNLIVNEFEEFEELSLLIKRDEDDEILAEVILEDTLIVKIKEYEEEEDEWNTTIEKSYKTVKSAFNLIIKNI